MGKSKRAHTLVAHHQVCGTLKENKSTVSREQRIMGSCVTPTRRHLFQSRCLCCLRRAGRVFGEERVGRRGRGGQTDRVWCDEHLVNRWGLQCIISHLLVIVQKFKFKDLLFIKMRSAQTILPHTQERVFPEHKYSSRLFYLHLQQLSTVSHTCKEKGSGLSKVRSPF